MFGLYKTCHPQHYCHHLFSIHIYLIIFSVVCISNPHAKRLYDDLLHDYNRLIRPVPNFTETLTVKLGLKLSQLIDVVNITMKFEQTNNEDWIT